MSAKQKGPKVLTMRRVFGGKGVVTISKTVTEIAPNEYKGVRPLIKEVIFEDPKGGGPHDDPSYGDADVCIGFQSFANNAELERVTFSGIVTSIGQRAFANRPKLTTLIFPEICKLRFIHVDAFKDCRSLNCVVMPRKKYKLHTVGDKDPNCFDRARPTAYHAGKRPIKFFYPESEYEESGKEWVP